jgi:hypothetical protein
MLNSHSKLGQWLWSRDRKRFLSIMGMFLAMVSVAPAGVIDATNVPVEMGTSFADLGFATVAAIGDGADATFHSKTIGAYTGFGIGGGYSDAEIDLDGEKLTVEYDNPTVITELILAFLYPNQAWEDVVDEVARVTVVTPVALVGELTALGSASASWTGSPSAVINLDPAVFDSAGVWRIAMPFGSQLVQKIEFTSVAAAGGPDSALNSDFGIVSITDSDGQQVPEAATVSITGAGLLLVGLASRKWRSRRGNG